MYLSVSFTKKLPWVNRKLYNDLILCDSPNRGEKREKTQSLASKRQFLERNKAHILYIFSWQRQWMPNTWISPKLAQTLGMEYMLNCMLHETLFSTQVKLPWIIMGCSFLKMLIGNSLSLPRWVSEQEHTASQHPGEGDTRLLSSFRWHTHCWGNKIRWW